METKSSHRVVIKTATQEDWETIRSIANKTWPHTFGNVISKDQLQYMLAVIYNEESIKNQMQEKGHIFILALNNDGPIGFASYELNFKATPQLMLHKIYLLPEAQGMGIGKMILSFLEKTAKSNNNNSIRLKVFHKNDKAIGFYTKHGFEIIAEETTIVGEVYTIIDYVMKKIV